MNLRSLRYFLTVTEHGSITRAAAALRITQPSLTQHLRHLEDHFGLPLFMRHGRGVILTEAGKTLRLRAEILIDQIDSLPGELESSQATPRGMLTVGMPISWSELVTYPVIERFRREHPAVHVKLEVNASEALAERMNRNEMQIAVLLATDEQDNIRTSALVEDDLFLLGPAGSELKQLGEIALGNLSAYPMILPLNLTMVMRRLTRALADAGGSLESTMEVPSTNILPLIARGLGYTILSACALPRGASAEDFDAIPIKSASMTWALATPMNRPKTAAVSVFEKMVREQVAEAVGAGRWPTARLIRRRAAVEDEANDGTRLRL